MMARWIIHDLDHNYDVLSAPVSHCCIALLKEALSQQNAQQALHPFLLLLCAVMR